MEWKLKSHPITFTLLWAMLECVEKVPRKTNQQDRTIDERLNPMSHFEILASVHVALDAIIVDVLCDVVCYLDHEFSIVSLFVWSFWTGRDEGEKTGGKIELLGLLSNGNPLILHWKTETQEKRALFHSVEKTAGAAEVRGASAAALCHPRGQSLSLWLRRLFKMDTSK